MPTIRIGNTKRLIIIPKSRSTEEIYHGHNGVDRYRSMTVYLKREGYPYSAKTIHKYMNKEMHLYSIARPPKPGTKHGETHKIFENQL